MKLDLPPSGADAAAAMPLTARRPFYRSLYFVVLVAIVLGAVFGQFAPEQAVAFKPLSDAFIKVLKMMLPPIIFVTMTVGLGSLSDIRKVGRLGWKSLLYFELGTTAALILGLLVVHLVQPGAGMNVNAAALDVKSVAGYAKTAEKITVLDYFLGIIPVGVAEPFVTGELMQVLFMAVLAGLAMGALGDRVAALRALLEEVTALLFKVVGYLMYAAPLAAFGAMAFTVGKYGFVSVTKLASLVACFYGTGAVFVFGVLGIVAAIHGFSMWRFLRFIKEELLLTLGCSTQEPALPLLMAKLERLGVPRSVVSFVVPAGYSFNLDGACVYLTIAFVFIAQATNTHLTWAQELTVVAVMLLTSKGAAGVPGGGFVALAATLAAVPSVPLAGLTLLVGVDRFMSEVRSLINMIGNGVAAIVVARWEGELDLSRCNRVLAGDDGSAPAESTFESPEAAAAADAAHV